MIGFWENWAKSVHFTGHYTYSVWIITHMSEVAYTSQDPRRDRALVEQSGILLRVPYS